MNTDRFFVAATATALLALGLGLGGAAAQNAPAGQAAAPGAVSAAALSGQAAAMHEALSRRLGAGHPALAAYAARDWQPVWVDGNGRATDAAHMLVDHLRRADEHALPVSKYDGDALAGQLGRPGTVSLEADLTKAFLDYATDVSSGVLRPGKVDKNLHISPVRPDPARLLAGAATAANMAAYLDSLAPQDPLYRRLVERYRAFRSVAGSEIWGPEISPGATLRQGDRSARVAQARARLTAMGDLDPNVYGYGAQAAVSDGTRLAAAPVATDAAVARYEASLFDQQMTDALMRFQARHGLNQDGLVGPATLAQLNVSPRDRAAQIAVNLERLRWLNQDLGERHILVNLAGFEMAVVERGRPVLASKVIVGQSENWQTPEFNETMTHMVVNPTWYVPMSIARQKILPKLKQDPSYLARQGMRLIGAGASAEQIDWSGITPDTFPGRVTQLPGDANALGNVKFMFPNPYSVYLHDTPAKELFERDVRDFSHGCVRVAQPYELAEYLLSGQASDPMGYFESIVEGGDEKRINLDRPVPVWLTYRSAWIDENGVEQFRGDIYERDRRIAAALQSAGVRILN